jgi:CubicO group peptidase (beta-lactamase class C family)
MTGSSGPRRLGSAAFSHRRIYSMTKPITGVAVLMLMEEGKLRLSDPISKYLPALKNPKVIVETVDAQGRRATSTVPADREISIQDLLRHTPMPHNMTYMLSQSKGGPFSGYFQLSSDL